MGHPAYPPTSTQVMSSKLDRSHWVLVRGCLAGVCHVGGNTV